MTRGKHWTPEQETELKTLIDKKVPLTQIATNLQRTHGAIIIKAQRLGLKLDSTGYTSVSISIPRQLPSVEETLKMLAGALKTASKPGLDKVEVSRIQAVANIAKTYKDVLADYINYREIETELKKMEEENARLLKETAKSHASQPDSPPVA